MASGDCEEKKKKKERREGGIWNQKRRESIINVLSVSVLIRTYIPTT